MINSIKDIIKINKITRTLIYKPYSWLRNKKIEKIRQKSSDLNKIGLMYGTDKSDNSHTYNNLTYLDIYEKYFSPIRFEKLKIVEIGVRGGNSLRVWKSYFPNAQIYGIDINPECKKHQEDRIKIYIGSQNDTRFLQSIIDKVGLFDVVVDDGSHINELTIKSFNFLFPYVKQKEFILLKIYQLLTKTLTML